MSLAMCVRADVRRRGGHLRGAKSGMETIKANSVSEHEMDMNRRKAEAPPSKMRRLLSSLLGHANGTYSPRRSIDREQQYYSTASYD